MAELIRVCLETGEELPLAPRPTHGLLDAALVAALTQRALLGCDESERRVLAIASEVRQRLWGDGAATPPEPATLTQAVELLDAILEAVDVHEAGAATAITFSGILPPGCRDFLVGADGEVLRERTKEERRPDACATGCPDGFCARREGPSVDVQRAIREWRLCGGARRSCLPRAGGLAEQDTATIFLFGELDAAAALVDRPATPGGRA